MIRVFPQRTKWTPDDPLVFIGDPPLLMPPEQPVRVSCVFTWDREESLRLGRSWMRFYSDVKVGGPAFNNKGGDFVPGRYLKEGATITSRGCPKHCAFCMVPKREGKLRILPITEGWNIMDNNILACPREHIEAVFEMLSRQDHYIMFSGGLDKELLTDWHVCLMKELKIKRAYFALDFGDQHDFFHLHKAADLLSDLSREKKYCYVLVGYGKDTPEQAEHRLREVYKYGFMPFAMYYRGKESIKRMSIDPAWRKLIRVWCNPARYKAILKGEGRK